MGKHAAPRRGLRQGRSRRADAESVLIAELALLAIELGELRAEVGLNRRAIALAYQYAGIASPPGLAARHLRAVPDQRDEAG